ncbi:Planctomycete cytochrome C [Polystyrenella longa]|uniref:Planctomycete cytochrome C n=1 Tax=Polystyrenella longa TaxID=2528007 RepID=A0A518CSB1_9PLAN|nr:DUF1553 domain-containing protein [Polystyrenella longa]QDU82112.1 Planctomycete cytochrome C [Polystyrenella longa]
MLKRAHHLLFSLGFLLGLTFPVYGAEPDTFFREQVAPILQTKCLRCHSSETTEGELDLSSAAGWLHGGVSGDLFDANDPDASLLLEYVSGDDPMMPASGPPLTDDELELVRVWLSQGANWPEDLQLSLPGADLNWWSLKPTEVPEIPTLIKAGAVWARTPVDHFVYNKLREQKLSPNPEADRRTLIRRLYYDVIGLPPTYEEVEEFINDEDPLAYEQLVDQLLNSPHYGERFARYWIDIVHWGETHGYDKDKPRPNAWPYRDYLIRAFNNDKPYERFVREQLAGDVLYPQTADGIPATGFIAAGPWDFIGHAEVPETKTDGQIARNLDRDDMVTTTMNTFVSTTVQCGRCHDHKFDPVSMEAYYSLQAVFSALDRADREFDADPEMAEQRITLAAEVLELEHQLQSKHQEAMDHAGPELQELRQQLAELESSRLKEQTSAFGYHSEISKSADTEKWVQFDLGTETAISQIVLIGAYDDYNKIGAGFGFPLRYRIDVAEDAAFTQGVRTIVDRTETDQANPGARPLSFTLDETARYVRVVATRLIERSSDYHLALGEVMLLGEDQTLLSVAEISSKDSIESGERWRKQNLTDGKYYGAFNALESFPAYLHLLNKEQQLLKTAIPVEVQQQIQQSQEALKNKKSELATLPAKQKVYCGLVYSGSGTFTGTGNNGGQPREIFILDRGDVGKKLKPVSPGTIPAIPSAAQFNLPEDHTESDRRVALADWIVREDNPLTWRSIVNRLWLFHFGRGIVDSPNDFGRMGQQPTHPELLDWLAVQFRDGGQSFKSIHRLILLSATYRQSSAYREQAAAVDSDNRFYWRMNRQRLDAEAIRDSVLLLSGNLNPELYGPSFQDFVIKNPEHSPHYEYELYDPTNPESFRRSVYRFLVRSQPQPFMETLDCADPSERVPKRAETLTVLQALALLNNGFMLHMADTLADEIENESNEPESQVQLLFRKVLQRNPEPVEQELFQNYLSQHGLANSARLLFNLNEFVFVD